MGIAPMEGPRMSFLPTQDLQYAATTETTNVAAVSQKSPRRRPLVCNFNYMLRTLLWSFTSLIGGATLLQAESATPELVVVVGAPGETNYATVFAESARDWLKAGTNAHANIVEITGAKTTPDGYQQLKATLLAATNSPADLWLAFIGHGTFDGKEAKFNLVGPDVSATEIADWLKPAKRRVVIFQGASASAPFINRLSASNHIIITATRSGSEQNYARFGSFAAEALNNPLTDIDHDDQNSALEIFLAAARMTTEWYKSEGRLATEHPLIDDNGDGRGTPADWFQGLRMVKKTSDGSLPDGLRANQVYLVPSKFESKLTIEEREWRNAKEIELARLRERKTSMKEDAYFLQLEQLLLELSHFYDRIEKGETNGIQKPST